MLHSEDVLPHTDEHQQNNIYVISKNNTANAYKRTYTSTFTKIVFKDSYLYNNLHKQNISPKPCHFIGLPFKEGSFFNIWKSVVESS